MFEAAKAFEDREHLMIGIPVVDLWMLPLLILLMVRSLLWEPALEYSACHQFILFAHFDQNIVASSIYLLIHGLTGIHYSRQLVLILIHQKEVVVLVHLGNSLLSLVLNQ